MRGASRRSCPRRRRRPTRHPALPPPLRRQPRRLPAFAPAQAYRAPTAPPARQHRPPGRLRPGPLRHQLSRPPRLRHPRHRQCRRLRDSRRLQRLGPVRDRRRGPASLPRLQVSATRRRSARHPSSGTSRLSAMCRRRVRLPGTTVCSGRRPLVPTTGHSGRPRRRPVPGHARARPAVSQVPPQVRAERARVRVTTRSLRLRAWGRLVRPDRARNDPLPSVPVRTPVVPVAPGRWAVPPSPARPAVPVAFPACLGPTRR